jgi:hypothetical protein
MAMDFVSVQKSTACAPTTAFPLDARSYFESYNEANKAAQEAKPAGDTSTVYYFGQLLTVFEDGEAKLYTIQPNSEDPEPNRTGKLVAVGSNTTQVVSGNLMWHSCDANGKVTITPGQTADTE